MKFSQQIAKGALIVFLGMIVGKALSYFYVILLSRLGSSTYGLLSIGFAIISFLIIISLLGLSTSVTRYVAYYIGKKDKKRIKSTITSSIKIVLPLSILISFTLFILSKQISIIIFNNADLIPTLKLFSLTIPFLALTDLFLSFIIGFQKIGYRTLIKDIIETSIKLFLTFIFISFGYGLFGVVAAYIISIIITFILSFYFIKKAFPILNKNIKSINLTKELLKFSLPLLFMGFLNLIIKWTDVLMIGYFIDASQVGVYNVALPTANLLILTPTALMAIFLPIITGLYSQNRFNQIKKISKTISKWIFFINLPIFFLIALLSKQIITIMFGPDYINATIPLYILLFGYLIHSFTHVHSSALTMIKRTNINFYIMLVSIFINITINYILIPKIGIIGGAIATSLSLIFVYLSSAYANYRINKVQVINFNYIKILFSSITSTMIISKIIKYFIIDSILDIILVGLLFVIIYLFLLIITKSIGKEDKEILSYFYNRLMNKNQ